MYTVTDKKLCEVYPGFSENKEKYKKRIEAVTDGYKRSSAMKRRVFLLRPEGRRSAETIRTISMAAYWLRLWIWTF